MVGNFLTYIDTLLDAELSYSVDELLRYENDIGDKIRENRLLFEKKISSLAVKNENVNEAIAEKVKLLESDLHEIVSPSELIEVGALRALAGKLLSYLEADKTHGLYLTEEAANILLQKHPPKNLLTLETSLLLSLSSLEKISLTRHSESSAWQEEYLNLLQSLPPNAFEERSVTYTVIDTGMFSSVMYTSDMKQKPWRMSHAKETGCINIFTQTEESIQKGVPVLQFVLVLYHYYFETLFTGQFSLKNAETLEVGKLLTKIITTGKDQFAFFHPNCYTEHLYWTYALEKFSLYIQGKLDISFFADTLTCGEYLDAKDTTTLISLNLIDHIWNLNIERDAEKLSYFQFSDNSFLYHFREGLWYEILSTISHCSSFQMQVFLRENLHLGDKALTKAILSESLS